MITLEEAQRFVLESCTPLEAATIAAVDAVGCVLAEAVVSAEAVPPFANTAVDGFAVQAADTAESPVELDVVGFLPAGQAPSTPVGPGQAIRIMTGAPIPDGADAVVMVEVTEKAGDDRVRVQKGVKAGDNVRAAAEDVAPGQQVFGAGTEVTPALVGVLASLGKSDVTVVRRPRVGVLSTGDELVEGDGPLEPGQIRESNRPALLASCRAAGFEAVDLGLVADDDAAITAALERGVATCDAVLSSGGVSMGDVDLVKVVLDRLSGGSFRWMQIAIKPAKPFAFGVIDGTPVFGSARQPRVVARQLRVLRPARHSPADGLHGGPPVAADDQGCRARRDPPATGRQASFRAGRRR